jgi:hypothetical protein
MAAAAVFIFFSGCEKMALEGDGGKNLRRRLFAPNQPLFCYTTRKPHPDRHILFCHETLDDTTCALDDTALGPWTTIWDGSGVNLRDYVPLGVTDVFSDALSQLKCPDSLNL